MKLPVAHGRSNQTKLI